MVFIGCTTIAIEIREVVVSEITLKTGESTDFVSYF